MRSWTIFLCIVASILTSLSAERAPNVIFILADDLGYGDVGAYGQRKIRTPNIDRLANEGMRFTQHYSGSPVCAPSRCVLMTGKHPGHAIVRDNREIKPEGQFPLPTNTFTLLRAFQSRGWKTGAFGKWGLGGPRSSGDPLHQGVDRFFGYNCQRVAHNFYPTSLWDNAKILPLNNAPFSAHQKLPADANPNDAKSYAAYSGKDFAPDLIADQAIRFIRENKDRSFFLYFPTTIPHLALQVPENSLAEYRGAFPDEPYTGGKNYLPHKAPRAAYAALVTRLDSYIGRMMQTVADLGLDRDTIFIFTSDNGPPPDRLGGTDAEFFESAKNFRGRKGSVYEGGVRVPCIVRWKSRITPGSTSSRVTGFEDWVPTLLQLCALDKDIPKNIDGISFASTLLGKAQAERPFLYREFAAYGGQQSIRVGDWKAVRQNLQRPRQPIRTELFNLAKDPTESADLAKTEPEILAKLERLMAEQRVASPDFPIRALDGQSNP